MGNYLLEIFNIEVIINLKNYLIKSGGLI